MQPLTTPHWIVFDLDETLAETERHGFPSLIQALQAEILKTDPELPQEFDAFWNHIRTVYPRTGNIVHAITKSYGLPPEWEENIHITASPGSAAAVIKGLVPDNTLPARLESLKIQGHHLHILTLGHADYAVPVLHHLGLHGIFTPHIHTRAFKRVAVPYLSLLSGYPQLKQLPKLMVEDSPANLIPAKELGFTTIGIGRKTLGHPAVDHHFPTISDFLAALGV